MILCRKSWILMRIRRDSEIEQKCFNREDERMGWVVWWVVRA